MSPTEWCIITYAVPGASGPDHVPMIPFTDCRPMNTSFSNQRRSRSVALIVNSRVMSATVCWSTSLRSCHASCATSLMSAAFLDPTCGGVSISSGPMMLAMRPIHASNLGHWSASCLENFAIDSWSLASSPDCRIEPSGSGR